MIHSKECRTCNKALNILNLTRVKEKRKKYMFLLTPLYIESNYMAYLVNESGNGPLNFLSVWSSCHTDHMWNFWHQNEYVCALQDSVLSRT